jgi:hypothetical protein
MRFALGICLIWYCLDLIDRSSMKAPEEGLHVLSKGPNPQGASCMASSNSLRYLATLNTPSIACCCKNQDHKCLVGSSIPLAGNAVHGGACEAKASIALGMPQHDGKETALVLPLRLDGHGRRAHVLDSLPHILDFSGEKRM